ncbi:MAG: DUF4173 domain-containing protein [Clostridia bacterium]|nr:DUF4173 domain-containing protein [Clostridia bacterium]
MDENNNSPLSQEQQKPLFRREDLPFGILALLFGFLFIKYTMTSAPGLMLTVLTLCFVGATVSYAVLRDRPLNAAVLFWGGVQLVISLTYPLTANGFLKGWCVFFQLLAGAYWIFLIFGNRTSKYADDMLGFDLLKSLFILPILNFTKLFSLFAESGRTSKGSRRFLYILLGLGVALLPTIVVALLLSGDSLFANMMEYLFSDLGEVFGNNIIPLLFGIPSGMLLFGLWYGAAEKTHPNMLNAQAKAETVKMFRIASPLITGAAMIPMLGIYILYFISQAGYFLGAFENLKPEGYSYAEYAREGFFNLCAVCFINGLVVLTVHFLTKRRENGEYAPAAKAIVCLFSLSSIVLGVIALRKMIMYIDQYGLTLSRIYASWFILLLSVFFLILIVKQMWSKLNGTLCALMAFLLLFGGICLVNIDARVAEYNIDLHLARMEQGEDSVLDIAMFREDLSFAAVIALDARYDQLDEESRKQADAYLQTSAIRLRKELNRSYAYSCSFRSWDLDTMRAAEILRKHYPEQFEDMPSLFGWSW